MFLGEDVIILNVVMFGDSECFKFCEWMLLVDLCELIIDVLVKEFDSDRLMFEYDVEFLFGGFEKDGCVYFNVGCGKMVEGW